MIKVILNYVERNEIIIDLDHENRNGDTLM